MNAEQIKQVLRNAERLYDASDVGAAYDRLAKAINRDLGDKMPLVLSVLTGGLIPTGHLLTRLDFPLELDYLHATRYQGNTRGSELHWKARPVVPLVGRTVLVVDDILDEGLTLNAIVEYCREQGAEQVVTAVLVDKRHDRRVEPVQATYVGLEVDDRYVFGCGMDYRGYLRNLGEIYAVTD